MNKVLVTTLLWGISSLSLANPDTTDEPLELTLDQMDNITAGAVNVSISTNAWASGPVTYTYTNTKTYTNTFSNQGVTVEYGVGAGVAVACCGPNSGTVIAAGASGHGDIVHTNAVTRSSSNRRGSYSAGYSTVFSITVDDRATANRAHVGWMTERAQAKIRHKLSNMRARF